MPSIYFFGGIGFFNKEDSTRKGGTVQVRMSERIILGGSRDRRRSCSRASIYFFRPVHSAAILDTLSQSGVVPYTSSSKVATGFTNCATLSYEVRYEKNQKQKTKAD